MKSDIKTHLRSHCWEGSHPYQFLTSLRPQMFQLSDEDYGPQMQFAS